MYIKCIDKQIYNRNYSIGEINWQENNWILYEKWINTKKSWEENEKT